MCALTVLHWGWHMTYAPLLLGNMRPVCLVLVAISPTINGGVNVNQEVMTYV